MAFKIDDSPADVAATLRELEQNPKLPAAVRAAMICAAFTLENHRALFEDAVKELDAAAALRVGMMDSQSRADDVARQVRATLIGLSSRMQQILTMQYVPPAAPPADQAVI